MKGSNIKKPKSKYDKSKLLLDEEFDGFEDEAIEDDNGNYVYEQFDDYIRTIVPCKDCDEEFSTNLSYQTKKDINNLCKNTLVKEAYLYESSNNPNQTYESFLYECIQYMAQCLIKEIQSLKI